MGEPHSAHQIRTALDAALAVTRDFGVRSLQGPRWQPSPDSEAARELATTETRQNGEPWGEDIVRTTYTAAGLLMNGVLDNLGSLRQLIADPMPAMGSTVIARSAMDIGATVWWLMQPGIGARRRMCRQLVLHLTSARREEEMACELNDSEAEAEASNRKEEVLQLISDLAIAPPTGKRYEPIIGGEARPCSTALTADMLKPCYPSLPGIKSFFHVYSAVTHGEIYGLMNFTRPIEQPDGPTLLTWELRGSILYNTVELAIFAFREPFNRIHQHMNWGHIEYDLWASKAKNELGKVTRKSPGRW